MVGNKSVTELRLRKRALIVESELNRLTLQAEVYHLRSMIGDFGQRPKAGSWLQWLAPVAGYWIMRRFRRRGSRPNRTPPFIRPLLSLYALWQNFRGKRPAEDGKD